MKSSKIISVLFATIIFVGLFSSSVFARQYDQRTGHFTRRDPIGYVESVGKMQVNLYTYAVNNPVNFTDPTGMLTKKQEWDRIKIAYENEVASKNKSESITSRMMCGNWRRWVYEALKKEARSIYKVTNFCHWKYDGITRIRIDIPPVHKAVIVWDREFETWRAVGKTLDPWSRLPIYRPRIYDVAIWSAGSHVSLKRWPYGY